MLMLCQVNIFWHFEGFHYKRVVKQLLSSWIASANDAVNDPRRLEHSATPL